MRTPARTSMGDTGGRGAETGTFMTMGHSYSFRSRGCSQVAGLAQALEGILRFVIHGATGSLRNLGGVELGDDLSKRAGVGGDRKRDVGIAERAVALAVAREIERNDRNAFPLRVGPDVALGPMQDRMHAQMRAGWRGGVEVVPELGRLLAHVPEALGAARGEHPLLGAGRFLVAPDAGDQPIEAMLGERQLEPFGLARRRARRGRQGRVDRVERRTGLDQEIEIPLLRIAPAERVHLRKFLAGIDMHDRAGHAPKERLARQPDHHVGILAERPQHGEALQPRECLAQDEDALGFELVETVHGVTLIHARRAPTPRPSLFSCGPSFSVPWLTRAVVEYFPICDAILRHIWKLILVNKGVPTMAFVWRILAWLSGGRRLGSARDIPHRSKMGNCALSDGASDRNRWAADQSVLLELPRSFGI